MSRNKKRLIRVPMLFLITILCFSVTVLANADDSIAPYASDYLDSYNAYVCPMSWGKIEVWFTVTADTDMDDIGALTVQIYESTDNSNWTWVKTVRHTTQSDMLGHNDYYHSGHVDYQGTIGRYYKAYVTIWAGKDGGGDTRYMWTQPKKATLLAG